MLMAAIQPQREEPKGRPPLRKVPDDFDVIFVEVGREGCESWYRAHKRTVTRWLVERGKDRLIKARAAYVKHQRAQGKWLTRATCMVEHRVVKPAAARPVRDRRAISGTLARHAAQFLRIHRNGGFIVSQSKNGDWRVGARALSAAQMVDMACSRGFDRDAEYVERDPASADVRRGINNYSREDIEQYREKLKYESSNVERRIGANWRPEEWQ